VTFFLDINSRFSSSLPEEKAIAEKNPTNNIPVLGIFTSLMFFKNVSLS